MAKKKLKKRVAPQLTHGSLNREAPFWKGETAEERLKNRPKKTPKARRRSIPGKKATPAHRELKRLERALPRRKTLVARQRLEQRIADLKKELNLK